MFTAVSGAIGLAVLAGCATRHSGLSASDEMARYLQNARGRYAIPGPPQDPWGPYIKEASNRFDMPETWIRALMRQESGGNLYRNGRLITSSAGAMGLMQVMPGTYRELRARHNLGPDPFDPHDNILAGVGYMREMYDMYGAPGFLAAYNAGPNRLDDYLANQRSLPDETRRYVAAIGPSLRTASPRVRSPAEQFAMNTLPLYIPPGTRYGYGSAPAVQYASASPSYTQVASAASARPFWATQAPQPRAVAYAQAATPAPAPQPRAVAWAQPAAPTYAPAQPAAPAYAAAPAPTPVGRAVTWEEPKPAAAPAPQRATVVYIDPPAAPRRARYYAQHQPSHQARATRTALAIRQPPPLQRSGGSLHLISSAVAAEAVPARRVGKAVTVPVSYSKPEHGRARTSSGSTWKLHASGPVQAAPACHKNARGKLVCGPQRL